MLNFAPFSGELDLPWMLRINRGSFHGMHDPHQLLGTFFRCVNVAEDGVGFWRATFTPAQKGHGHTVFILSRHSNRDLNKTEATHRPRTSLILTKRIHTLKIPEPIFFSS